MIIDRSFTPARPPATDEKRKQKSVSSHYERGIEAAVLIHTSRDGCLNLTIVSGVRTPFLKHLSDLMFNFLVAGSPPHILTPSTTLLLATFMLFVSSPNETWLLSRHTSRTSPSAQHPHRARKANFYPERSHLKRLAKDPRMVRIALGFKSRI